jgi:hypothetical protein
MMLAGFAEMSSSRRASASPWEDGYDLSLKETEQYAMTSFRAAISDALVDDNIREWCTDACLVRYLRARNWDLAKAESMIRETIKWRTSVRPQDFSCEPCQENPYSHSMRQVGWDVNGHPVMYSVLAPKCVRNPEQNVHHLTWMLERTVRNLPVGVSKWVWVIDLHGFKFSDASPSQGKMSSKILSDHYPERLAKAFIVDGPAIFRGFWSICKTVLSKETVEKVDLFSFKKAEAKFAEWFDDEMMQWMLTEMRENREKKKFADRIWWGPNVDSDHDPRGIKAYVDQIPSMKP